MQLFSSSTDNTIRSWDASNGQCIIVMLGHTAPVEHIILSEDGSSLYSASRDNTMRIWNAIIGDCIKIIEGNSSINTIACVSDDSIIFYQKII